ncbi:hypothetical protein DL766_000165 [Monosporascus sp. MC13-8B]|uniref:C3H1-type domain-containing protein n=1 Tax=Monosporascus cannonballus TaxID=155416 RepID=A0ABY0H7V8_9PEZI|nr:hypothetical protein DL762_004568 [Monosporascus cannonballus]RYP39956.1 hypothetical protein DL766_000165 [Monosporascus sp. MC13-8B]
MAQQGNNGWPAYSQHLNENQQIEGQGNSFTAGSYGYNFGDQQNTNQYSLDYQQNYNEEFAGVQPPISGSAFYGNQGNYGDINGATSASVQAPQPFATPPTHSQYGQLRAVEQPSQNFPQASHTFTDGHWQVSTTQRGQHAQQGQHVQPTQHAQPTQHVQPAQHGQPAFVNAGFGYQPQIQDYRHSNLSNAQSSQAIPNQVSVDQRDAIYRTQSPLRAVTPHNGQTFSSPRQSPLYPSHSPSPVLQYSYQHSQPAATFQPPRLAADVRHVDNHVPMQPKSAGPMAMGASTSTSVPAGVLANVPANANIPANANVPAIASVPFGAPASTPRLVQTLPNTQQPDQVRNLGPVIGERPEGPEWKEIDGCPNLFFSEAPDPRMNATPNEVKKYAGKRTDISMRTNRSQTKLLPGRSRRLPGEVQRDYDAAIQQMNEPGHDHETSRIQNQIDALQSEMASLIGQTIKNKSDRKSRGRMANASDSEDDDSEDELDRKARQIKSAAISSADAVKAVEQNVVKIVWQDPVDQSPQNSIAMAIGGYGSLIEELWTEHKLLNKEHKAAVEQKTSRAKSLQDALKRQTELIHIAVETASTFGADPILDNMGSNQKLTIILLNFVRYCYAIKDFNGPAPKSVLELVSQFSTINTEFLGRLKLDSLRAKYIKDLDTESRKFFDRIFDNAKERDKQLPQPSTDMQDGNKKNSKTQNTTVSSATKDTPAAPKPQPAKKETGPKSVASDVKRMQPIKYAGLESARKSSNGTAGATTKRPRDDDSDSRSSKKVAVEGTTGAPAANRALPNAAANSSAAQPEAATTTVQTRPKTSASILPGKSRSTVKPAPKKTETQKSVLGSLLEEIAKPKETPKPREEPERPETEEEKARRLRKQSRRGRTVTWKPDDQLVEYRYFQHDSAEDEGRASNQLRDVRDNRSEGQMLKLLARGKKEREGEEGSEDDDEEDVRMTSLRAWKEPSVSDHSALGQDRLAKNFESRGGLRKADTEQQRFISDYESRELMSIYTTTAEIPNTPKSPPRQAAAEPSSQPSIVSITSNNKSKLQETRLRTAESRQYGNIGAARLAIARLANNFSNLNTAQKPSSHSSSSTNFVQAHPQPRMMTQEERDTAVLILLNSKRVTQWVDPDPYDPTHPNTQRRYDYSDPKVQEAADAIESVVEQLKDKPYPPTEPPQWLQNNPDRVKEWWTAHNASTVKALREATERAKRLAEEEALKAQLSVPQQQGAANPYAAILQQVQAIQANQANQNNQQPEAAPQPQAPATPDIQALLRTLSQTAQPTQVQAPVPAPAPATAQSTTAYGGDANAAAWMAYYAQFQNQNQGYAAYQQQQQQGDVRTEQQPPSIASIFSQAPAASGYNAEAQAAQWAAYYQQYQNHVQGQGTSSAYAAQEHQQQHDGSDQNNRRDRDRDRDRRGNRQQHGGNRGGGGGSGGDRDSRGINRSLIGTKPCTFWAKNQCTKGDKCTFRHDPADLVNMNY